jgi:hypothetical protein
MCIICRCNGEEVYSLKRVVFSENKQKMQVPHSTFVNLKIKYANYCSKCRHEPITAELPVFY